MLKKILLHFIIWLWIFSLPQFAWAAQNKLHHHTHTTIKTTKKIHHQSLHKHSKKVHHKKHIQHQSTIHHKIKHTTHLKKAANLATIPSQQTLQPHRVTNIHHATPAIRTAPHEASQTARSYSFSTHSNHITTALASEKLMAWVSRTVSKLKYSHYKFGGSYFNPAHGVYELDCSGYVNHLLDQAAPNAYHNVVHWTGSYKPTSGDYYSFFKELPKGRPQNDWYQVPKVSQLNPGDILVFRYGRHHFWSRHNTGGHVMVVVHHPVPMNWYSNTYLVRVADSASAGHSNDTRPAHTSGIGIGTLIIKVNNFSGKTCAFAWKVGSHWKYNVDLAMGRPLYA